MPRQVVTKTSNQPDVYEFVMNEAEYERRAETNSAVFKDSIRLRNVGKSKEDVSWGFLTLSACETLSACVASIAIIENKGENSRRYRYMRSTNNKVADAKSYQAGCSCQQLGESAARLLKVALTGESLGRD